MTMKTIAPAEGLGLRAFPGLSVYETAALLRRYQQVERACLRASIAWLMEAPRYEDKYQIGYHMWDHAEHVQWIRARLKELRGGHTEANIDPLLKICLDEVVHAQNTAELAAGMYAALKGALLDAYRTHLRLADPSANAAEVRLLERIVPDLERHLAWAEESLDREATDRSAAQAWGDYLTGQLRRAGGITGLVPLPDMPAPPRPHEHRLDRPRTVKFDDRIQHGVLASYENRGVLPIQEAVREQFKVFFNEWWAAGLLATVLYDAWEADCPWEFYYEMTHHCWDEVRHSEFGMIRLRELGAEPTTVNLSLFEQAVDWPFLHRLVYLTLDMEAYFMSRKRPRVQRYLEEKEDRSLIFADADWSDEINHVRYGKRWTDYFLKNDMRTPEDIKGEVARLIENQSRQQRASEKSPF